MENVKDTVCVKTLREIQGRITSISFVHDELYNSPDLVTLDFSSYLKKMIAYLFDFYKPMNKNIELKLNVEKILIGMDTAIPLGIIVNELLSNAVTYAFVDRNEGKITISLYSSENVNIAKKYINGMPFKYALVIQDDGIGFSNEIDFETTESLGVQIVRLLVEQIDGYIELDNNNGVKFTIWFNNINNIKKMV